MSGEALDDSSGGRYRLPFLLLALLIVATFAAYTNTHKVLWTDEAFALDTSGGTLGHAFRQAINYELQPPLYYLLLNLWLRLDHSIEFARWLSAGFALGTVAVLHRLARVLGLSARASLPLLAALCPYVLWAGTEARPYALALFLTSCATYLYVRLLTAPERDLRMIATLYVVTWYLTLLTFYYGGFLLLGQVIGTLRVRRRIPVVLACACAVAVLLVPWIPTILRQARVHPPVDLPPDVTGSTPLARGWSALVWGFQYVLESLFFAPILRRPIVLAVVAAAAATIVVVHAVGRSYRQDPMLGAFAITTSVPVLLLVGGKAGNVLTLEPRYLATVVVSLLVLMALAADRLPFPRGRLLVGICMLLFAALAVVSFQRNSLGYEDWKSAAKYVQARESPRDAIFVFEPDGVLPFRYYYRGPNPVFGLPVDRPTIEYSVQRQAIHSMAQLTARIDDKAGPGGEFWVVARRQHPVFGRYLLRGFLQGRAVALEEHQVEGIDLGRYRLDEALGSNRSASGGRQLEEVPR